MRSLPAPLRLKLIFLWRHGRLPDLDGAARFNDLVQARKLRDRDPRLATLSDKVAVKTFVANRVGREWVIPTLWHGVELPATPRWPLPFVVKSRHGCNQIAFVRTGREDWRRIRRRARGWMKASYGTWLDEWLYRGIAPGLLAEPFIGSDGVLPVDYKVFVFGGRAEFIQVHLEREHEHRRVIFDRNWRRVSEAGGGYPARPASFDRMIEAAEALACGFDFVRVDLYDPGPHPLFGEMTFYPGSGLDPFHPASLDALLGACWTRARLYAPSW